MTDAPQLSPLYKKTSTGAVQVWRVWTEGDRYFTESGQLDGRKVVSEGTLCRGKNLGRSNETTGAQQARAEANSKWEKKAKAGYCLTVEAALAGEVQSDHVAGGVLPMLAQPYSKHAAKIVFPAMVQPKLDGHRCLAVVNDDYTVTLWSRTRKVITGVPHVSAALESLPARLRPGTVLDGELYNHDYRDDFEVLTSFIRQATPKPGHEVVQYHVYDVASCELPFRSRNQIVRQLIPRDHPTLVSVYTQTADDADHLAEFMADQLQRGYEGAMVRNAESPYEGKRSYGLQKVKEFDDAEFRVVGVETGRGRMADKAVFVCETATGEEFRVKMQGKLDDLRKYVDDPWGLAIGRMLTVKFQNLTAAGVPRFPIGIRFRDEV